MLHTLVLRCRNIAEGKLKYEEIRAGSPALIEYAVSAMSQGGDRLDTVFGKDKPYYYYAIATTVARLVLGDDPLPEEIELVSRVVPAITNLVVGTAKEVGLCEETQYVLNLGGIDGFDGNN